MLTVREVAAQLRVSKMTVYRMIHAGEIRFVKVRGGFRIPAEALDDYVSSHSTTTA